MPRTRLLCGGATLVAAVAILGGCAAPPPGAAPSARAAWVQATAGGYAVRAITDDAACPLLDTGLDREPMTLRVAPAEVPARPDGAQQGGMAARFPERVCEAAVPPTATRLAVGALVLPLPRALPQRIVLLGDTGCRMKQSDRAFQDCADAAAWPFAQVARSAAAKHPDLVVHVGDYHYRESPCPPGRAGCAGSPWGYGADVWQADFFTPAAPLLAAAPWVAVRGNHESCKRAGVGWFRYLDGHAWRADGACVQPEGDAQGEFSEPYAVGVGAGTQFVVFDSAFVAGRAYAAGEAARRRYAELLAQADALVRQVPHTLFVNHHPVLAFGGSETGAPKESGAGLRSVFADAHPRRLFAEGVDVVVNGHIHLFEALDFDSPHPAQLLVGNGGSANEGELDAAQALQMQPAPGATVRSFVTQPGYGFATLDRQGTGWLLTEWDVAGRALLACRLDGRQWRCGSAR